jgi:peptidoglycan hydrolase CwlO-like protein
MKNENGKFEDLIQLHKDKELTTFQTLLIHELRKINESIEQITADDPNTLTDRISSIAAGIEDLTDEIVELRNQIRHNNQ